MNKEMTQPFYDPMKSYQENYDRGPFGEFADGEIFRREGKPRLRFLDQAVYLPFGIPAGPLLNGKFVQAAWNHGFDICVYKTVRTGEYPCHPWPNVLALHIIGNLSMAEAQQPQVADNNYERPLTITNSFGVPSMSPDIWQKDMRSLVEKQQRGQILVGSFQGTPRDGAGPQAYIDDCVLGARLVQETGVKILEMNSSCPNEGTANLLCFDVDRTALIVQKIKEEIGDTPFILKIAYFSDQELLRKLIQKVGRLVQAFSVINTIPAPIVDEQGNQALPGAGRLKSGVCGAAIRWAGLEMVKRMKKLREELGMNFAIIGVGGVMRAADYLAYRRGGADAVMSATGAMWNPHLAQEIWKVQQKGE